MFKYLLLYKNALLNLLFMRLLAFSVVFTFFLKFFSSFIIKYIHLVLSRYLLYILTSGKNVHKGLNFKIIFVTNQMFKILFIKRKLIRYYCFINIYIAYRNKTFLLTKFAFFNFSVIKLYNFLIHFYTCL